MEISTFQVDDPYAIHPLCAHRDARSVSLVTAEGETVPPFYVYAGSSPSGDETAIQFFGEVYQEIQWEGMDADGRQVAELMIVKFHMSADHPQFGNIDITLDTTRSGGFARLHAVNPGKKFPVIHSTSLHIIATVKAIPGLILQNAGPALQFISDRLITWPPEENIYRLSTNVKFEMRQSKGHIFMTASAGSAIVGKIG